MTGRELLFTLGGSAVLGGLAGIGGVVIATPARPTPPPAPDTSAMEARVAKLEGSLRDAGRRRDELEATVASLRKELAKAPKAAAGSVVPGAVAAPGTPGTLGPDGMTDEERDALTRMVTRKLGDLGLGGKDGKVSILPVGQDGRGMPAITLGDDAKTTLGGLVNGLRLRTLPEAERWKKAREDLDLTDAQVTDLQGAFAERDRALSDAMTTEKSEPDGEGGTFTVRRLDPDRAAAANRAYRDRVDAALTPDQKKKWNEKGYDHAFGETPGASTGSFAVTTVQTVIPDATGQEEDGRK